MSDRTWQCVFMILSCMAGGCHLAKTSLEVSPLGHGGRPAQWGPGPHSPPWRANLLAAPGAQYCRPSPGQTDIACLIPVTDAGYGFALATLEPDEGDITPAQDDNFVR
jgi:hypothetical protein